MFPTFQRGLNREEHAVFMTDRDHAQFDHVYRVEGCVMLPEWPGNFVAFLGSDIYHERVHPASAAILYTKANRAGSDPLGEDNYRAAELT